MGLSSCFFRQAFYCASGCRHCNFRVIVWQEGKQKTNFFFFSVESGRRAIPRQNENDRLHAIGMIQADMLHCAVAKQFGVHINTIQALWRRFLPFGIVRDRRRAGRQRVTSRQQDNHIYPTGAPRESPPNGK